MSDLLRRAAALARDTIDGNIHEARIADEARVRRVLLAGRGKFDALWARDACYASRGALAAGRAEAVRGTLEALLDFQFEGGGIPRRIGKDSVEWAAILYGVGVRRPRAARFDVVDRESPAHALGISGVICPDTNALVLVLADLYAGVTGDDAFLARYEPRLRAAHAWLLGETRDGLLDQEPYSDWKDTADRGRLPMYNQAVFHAATRALASILRRRGDAAGAARLEAQAEALAARIRAGYWDAARGFFRDSETWSGFSPDGNLIAIERGLATHAEARSIFAWCDALLEAGPLLPACEPPYPAARVPAAVRLVGLRHYHGSMAWPWQDSMHALAAIRAGDPARAERALAAVARLALRDGGFFEIYEGRARPRVVLRPFYASEPGFSWSAGLYLAACAELGIHTA